MQQAELASMSSPQSGKGNGGKRHLVSPAMWFHPRQGHWENPMSLLQPTQTAPLGNSRSPSIGHPPPHPQRAAAGGSTEVLGSLYPQ